MEIPQLKQKLAASFQETIEWIEAQASEKFEQGPQEKWDTSQHLDHLINVSKSVNSGLRIPKFIIRYRFGKPNRPSRNYEAIVARYQEKLKGLPPGFAPGGKKYPIAKKMTLLKKFDGYSKKVNKAIDKWTEDDLDRHLFPHPLLGKMTVRELLLWMTYHNYHHLNNLKANY